MAENRIKAHAPGVTTSRYIRFQLPSHPRYAALARDTVYRFCREHGLDAAAAFEMKIVCGEALNNVIKHAYGNRSDQPIFLEVLAFARFLELRIRDLGEQIPVTSGMARDLSDYREKGLGLYLIDKLSDYHYFDQSGNRGTSLIVKKRLPVGEEPGEDGP